MEEITPRLSISVAVLNHICIERTVAYFMRFSRPVLPVNPELFFHNSSKKSEVPGIFNVVQLVVLFHSAIGVVDLFFDRQGFDLESKTYRLLIKLVKVGKHK